MFEQATANKDSMHMQLGARMSSSVSQSQFTNEITYVTHDEDFKQPRFTKYKDADADPLVHPQALKANFY